MGWQRHWVSVVALTILGCGGADPREKGAAKRAPAPRGRALVITEIDQADVVNRPPRFLSVAPLVAREGRPYRYDFSTLDPDGDPVSYTLVEAPEGAYLEGHELKWVPSPGQAGHGQGFTLRAVDEWGASQDQAWEVVPGPGTDPEPGRVATPK